VLVAVTLTVLSCKLENAKLTEQLANPLPNLDNVIIGENPVAQPAPQPARSRKVKQAPNPLSQRKKKEIQTGRPSKKQLEAEKERQLEKEQRRAAKRPRDEGDSDDAAAEDKPAPSTRLERDAEENLTGNGSTRSVEQISAAVGDDVDSEQKKKRRKRRKKATGAVETGAEGVTEDAE
jgi:hypothetical protein